MTNTRARLQGHITAAAYLSFASALTGLPDKDGLCLPAFGNMEEVARWAIRRQMAMGHTEIEDYQEAFEASAAFVAEQFAAALPILLDYSRDEVFNLTKEELGLPSPTQH